MTINTLRALTTDELVQIRDDNYKAVWLCYGAGFLLCLTGVGILFGFVLLAIGQVHFGSKAGEAENELKRRSH